MWTGPPVISLNSPDNTTSLLCRAEANGEGEGEEGDEEEIAISISQQNKK